MPEPIKSRSPLDPRMLRELREAVSVHGEHEALRTLGVSRMGLYRAMAGLAVYAGTRALVRERLDELRQRQRR